MPETFTPHLYSFVPDRGFGVTPRASHVHLPAPCGTYQPLDIDAPDPDRPWRPGPSASVIAWGYFADAMRGTVPSQAEARAAAWAWHDRRHALAERLRSGLGDRLGRCDGLDFWPVILTWSDAQVAEVERWLVDSTAEMPEVLRG